MKFISIIVATLGMVALGAAQTPCHDRCQNEFVDCFTRTGDFDGCERIRSMSLHNSQPTPSLCVLRLIRLCVK